jgi:hypothetical protein
VGRLEKLRGNRPDSNRQTLAPKRIALRQMELAVPISY